MGFLKNAKLLFRSADLFYSTQVLRYNSKSQYKTVTGGLISLVMIVSIMAGFSTMIIQMVQKTQITSTLEVRKDPQPPSIQIIPQKDNFMLGVTIQTFSLSETYDLNKGPQIFDVVFRQVLIQGQNITRNMLKMEQCTLQHWSADPQVKFKFQSFQIFKWSCLKLNNTYTLAGVSGSKVNKYLQFLVYPCKNTTDNQNKCAPQEQIDQVFSTNTNFYFAYSFINPLINPNQPDHVQFRLDTESYAIFSKTIGTSAVLYFADYTVETDESILLFEDVQTKKGLIKEKDPTNHPYSIVRDTQPLARIFIGKSPSSFIYKRDFLKISTVISYIGGLMGAVIIVLFVINIYTDRALEFNVSFNLFSQLSQPQDPIVGQQMAKITFNLISFFSLYLYRVVRFFRKKVQCFKVSQEIDKYIVEINQHLDINILLRRIIKLEECVGHILPEDDIRHIKEKTSITYEKAKYFRTLLNSEILSMVSNQAENERERDNNRDMDQGQTNNRMITDFNGDNIARTSSLNRLESEQQQSDDENNGRKGLEIVLFPLENLQQGYQSSQNNNNMKQI